MMIYTLEFKDCLCFKKYHGKSVSCTITKQVTVHKVHIQNGKDFTSNAKPFLIHQFLTQMYLLKGIIFRGL